MRFKKVYIEVTNVCNLSCNFCPKTTRELKYMEESSFERILISIKPYTEHIYFHLMGEPLLNPRVGKFLKLSMEYGFKVNLTTNGTLLKECGKALLLEPALRQLNISLTSFEANDHVVSLEEYMDNIVAFLKLSRERNDKIISLRLWNMDSKELKGDNAHNIEIFDRLEAGLGLDFSLREQLVLGNSVKLANKIYLNMAEKFSWPDINKENTSKEVFCYGLRDQIGILVDGTVVPCCLDSEGKIELGNIFKEELSIILESERAVNLYDGFSGRSAVEELCQKCGYATRFNSSTRVTE